jgi:putative oxidoreductase
MIRRVALLLGRLILAGVFIYAAYTKLRAPWLQFAVSLSSYKILADNLLEPIARILPWCELALGIAILSGIWLRWFALIGSLLLGFFFAVMVRSYAMGLQIDCGCFGPGEALGPKTMIRDGLLLALAIAVTLGAFRSRRFTWNNRVNA